MRIFVSADKAEQIALLDRSSGKVLGIQRTVAVPEALSNERLFDTLRAKYGPPLTADARQGRWEWGKSGTYPCTIFTTTITQIKPVDDAPAPTGTLRDVLMTTGVGFITPWDYQNQPAPTVTQLAACDARLDVSRNTAKMSESVYDARIYGVGEADATARAASHASLPPL